jgi:hypothetical protein
VRNHFVRQIVRKILAWSKITAPPVDLLQDTVDALFIEDSAKVYAVNRRQQGLQTS